MTDRHLAALVDACRAAGLPARGAVLLRHHVNAVFLLPDAAAVVRLAPAWLRQQVGTSVDVARWLAARDVAVTELLEDLAQPIDVGDHVATFWRYYPQGDRGVPPTGELARLLRRLHSLDEPPFGLPAYGPLDTFNAEFETYAPLVLDSGQRAFLMDQARRAQEGYDGIVSVLGSGVIHADARVGNLLWDGDHARLGDWDSISVGPRELDLVVTCQSTRFGLSEADVDEFVRVYGWDVRRWAGYPVLRHLRDLQTLAALMRLAIDRTDVAAELRHRLAGLRAGDTRQRWTAF